mmetsp:Transcript_25974/g.73676  ORF Transcript_25974/g.73676 Transcript_25974/m.73676 type:complete len:563 (+) Transcript_25974:2-1690(+)
MALDAYPRADLPNESLVFFVVATTGDGDPPDNMKQFWRFLLRKGLPANVLNDLTFAVFGLGDSSYAKYNYTAKKLRNRLLQLGAKEFVERGFGDDQGPLGLEGDLDAWLTGKLWPRLLERYPLPAGYVVDESPQLFTPRHEETAIQVRQGGSPNGPVRKGAWDPERAACLARPVGCYETAALRGKVSVNKRITAEDWEQDVRHVEIEVGEGALPPYEPGDIAVVYPENPIPEPRVSALAALAGVPSPDALVTGISLPHIPKQVTFVELCTKYLDLLGTPRRSFFEALYFFTSDGEEKEKLEELCSPAGNDLYHVYCNKERKSFLEVLLDDFKTCRPPLRYLVEMIPRLEPREYSISSARPSHGPGTLHLTVAILQFLTPWGRMKTGVASSWLQAAVEGSYVPLYIKRGTLRAPSDGSPLILIGPGTGVAPLRSIIHDRGDASCRLYFGCRSREKDFYYGDEWAAMQQGGRLGALRVAFSRDQTKKVYVQHLIKEDAEEIARLLVEQDASCFISGSAKRMPTDVREALAAALVSTGTASTEEEAQKALRRLEQVGRFKIESWS